MIMGHTTVTVANVLQHRFHLGTCESFFFVRIESRIESAVRFVFKSNLRIESAVYTTQAVTQPDGLQAYRKAYNMLPTSIVNERE